MILKINQKRRAQFCFLLAAFFWLFFSSCTEKKDFHDDTLPVAALDSVFSEIPGGNIPGVSAILWYKGKIAYQSNKGHSNLRSGTPITATTAFNIGQIADHFTAFAILNLINKGKLKLEDSVNKYLKTRSALLDTIKIRHLLAHSSGLYDIAVLNELLQEDLTTNESVIQKIVDQKQFSFVPGESFAVNRTNLFLLERIVERVAQQAFERYMVENVFVTAGLTNTYFIAEGITTQNVAISYELEDGKYENSTIAPDVFSPKVYSSSEDLITWELYLQEQSKLNPNLEKLLNTVAALDDGTQFNAPAGKLTYSQRYKNAERGLPELYNTGEYLGYASSIFRFPTEDFIAVVLTNNGMDYSGYFGMLSAYEIIDDRFKNPPTVDYASLSLEDLSPGELKSYEGFFWDADGELVREIGVRNDTLRYVRSEDNQSALLPVAKDTFQMMFPGDESILVRFYEEGSRQKMDYLVEDADPIPFYEFENRIPKTGVLKMHVGRYHNKEYGISFEIAVEDNSLVFKNSNGTELSYNFIEKGLFHGGSWYMQSVAFEYNQSDEEAIGFSVNNPSLRNLFFERDN